MKNRRYLGEYRFKDTVAENVFPILVTPEIFDVCQRHLAANQQRPAHFKDVKDKYLLTGKIFCGHCGGHMSGVSGTGTGGITHRYYHCNAAKRKKLCNKKRIKKDLIENIVIDYTFNILNDKSIVADRIITDIFESIKEFLSSNAAPGVPDVAEKYMPGHGLFMVERTGTSYFVLDKFKQKMMYQIFPFLNNLSSMGIIHGNNSIMELVRHTIEFIKRKPYEKKLLVKVKDEVKLVIDATSEYEPYDRQKIIECNKKNVIRHAYFKEYLALQRLCLLILQRRKHQIGVGSRQIYGLLFDGAWLWEEYINLLIEDAFYHPMNKAGKGAQRLFSGNIGLIYPDFIGRNSERRIIADAKYKPIDNIGNKDYLQVLAYMFRFDAKEGYYLYPEASGSDDLKLWMNRGSTYESNVTMRDDISITKHGLKIPVEIRNYDEFVKKMNMNEQEFKSVFLYNV